MIGVLIPSRGRPEQLEKALDSLSRTAGNTYLVMVALDQDDPRLDDYHELFQRRPELRVAMDADFTERYGYGRLHEYVNFLASDAISNFEDIKWFFLFNDDTTITSDGWDEKILAFDHNKPLVLNYDPRYWHNLFPIMSRRMYEILGHFSLSPHNDSYVQTVANLTDIHVHVPGMTIEHNRIMDDQTAIDRDLDTQTSSPAFWEQEIQDAIAADVEKIRKALQA